MLVSDKSVEKCAFFGGKLGCIFGGSGRVYAKGLGPSGEGEELMREFEDGEKKDEGLVREEKIGGVTRRDRKSVV